MAHGEPGKEREPIRSSAPFLWLVRCGLRAVAKLEITGVENVPDSGPCLVVFNQLSLLDTPLIRIAIPRPDVAGLVAWEYSHNWFFRFMVEQGGGIWIERRKGDRGALDAALRVLRQGWVVGISPEGRRSHSGGLERGKPGVATLAYRANCPIVPAAFVNMDQIAARARRLRRTEVSVRFGAPIRLPPLQPGDRKRQRQMAVDQVMCRLASLLPPRYRGVYADHPELRRNPDAALGEVPA